MSANALFNRSDIRSAVSAPVNGPSKNLLYRFGQRKENGITTGTARCQKVLYRVRSPRKLALAASLGRIERADGRPQQRLQIDPPGCIWLGERNADTDADGVDVDARNIVRGLQILHQAHGHPFGRCRVVAEADENE